jgi:hypothetical protein
MALEDLTGADKFVGNLVITNPLSADDRREGDDHIRGIKNVLKNSFPTLSGPVTFSDYVLKAGDTMTGALKLADGTVAAPGLAFASEPGLGFYRRVAGAVSLSASGQRGIDFAMSGAGATITVTPLAANGSAGLVLTNQTHTAPSYNVTGITTTAAGYTVISNSAAGISGPQPMLLQAVRTEVVNINTSSVSTDLWINKNAVAGSQASIFGVRGGLTRWRMDIGDGTPESGGNAGSDFRLLSFNDAGAFNTVALAITRGTNVVNLSGQLSLNGPGAGQIVFPVAQNPSSNPNVLDDYEEGTFTLVNGAAVGMTATGSYVKVGRSVTWAVNVNFASNSSGGSVTLSGLPYPGQGPGTVGYPGAVLPAALYCNVSGADIAVYCGNAFATFAQLTGATVYLGGAYLANQ